MSWTGALCVLMGAAVLSVASYTMAQNPNKNSSDYQLATAGVFVALLCTLFGILMLKSGLGTLLFTTSARPTIGGGGAVMGGYDTGYGYGGSGYY